MKKWLGIIIASALLAGCSVGGGFGVGNGGAGVSLGTGIGF
ncbi:MAG: hypothetical protein Q4A81_06220 [Pasteurellaceae bacterium]|nr:hypothetical protein [Pasteurellaceae bacterium]